MSFCYISHSVEWKVLWLLTHHKRVQPILVGLVTPEIRISALKKSTSSTTFLVLSASVYVCVRCRILGYYGHFCPQAPAQSGIMKHRAILFSLFPIQADGYCLFMDTAGSRSLCVIMYPAGFASWPHLMILPLPAVLASKHQPAGFGAFQIHMNVSPSAFTTQGPSLWCC